MANFPPKASIKFELNVLIKTAVLGVTLTIVLTLTPYCKLLPGQN